MAKADWLKISAASGSGNGSINVSTDAAHTGRTARTTTLTFKAANCTDVARTVNQAGKPEYVDIDNTASSAKAGQTVTIQGVSNSQKLTFSKGTGDLEITLPSSYTANSVSTANGSAITGDPGASQEFNFSISIVVPSNTGVTALTKQIIVTDENGNTDTCTLTLAAGDAYLTVAVGDINLTYQGTAVAVAVESNVAWTVV